MVEDAVFAAALSPGAGTLTITSGTNVVTRKVLAGITTLSAPMGLGRPTFALRNTSGHIVLKGKGSLAITKTPCAIYNFNALWVTTETITQARPTANVQMLRVALARYQNERGPARHLCGLSCSTCRACRPPLHLFLLYFHHYFTG